MSLIVPFFIGIITWPILEYSLHRFLGHVFKLNTLFKVQHTRHHIETNYFAPNFYKILAAIPASILVYLLGFLLFKTWFQALSLTLGFIVMYAFYEWTHYSFHMHAPKTKLGLNLRRHHFAHHFHNAKFNHGVTTNLLDHLCGTYLKVDKVKVPKSLLLPWLTDQSGQVKPEFSHHFEVK